MMERSLTRLVGDVGGTNARFALVPEGGSLPERERTLPCTDFPDLEAAVRHYLALEGNPPVRAAAVAVATPITSDQIRFTNNHWAFSVDATRQALGLDRLVMVNDFTALALSLPLLRPDELRQVGGSTGVPGRPIALLGPGTGLGVSGLIPHGNGWIPLEGEGGHTAFSPTTPREARVLETLWTRFDHVSTERLVSGPGLVLLYEVLCGLDHVHLVLDTPHQITEAGIARSNPQAFEALTMFCAILGAAAANLCLTLGARGGVFVGGGIVPRLGSWFDTSPFRARFETKGRFSDYVAAVPVFVITGNNPALRGVAQVLSG
ncbi:MAG: glucokinase [Burkholderiales bacterium]|nr:glucokinase [Burkholderiales bacterium]